MTKIYKVSDDGQLITKLTTEEVKAIAREQLASERAPQFGNHTRRSKERDCCFGS